MVGDATVGKTTIVNQLVSQSFNSAYTMTQACDYKIKEIDIPESKTTVELHILDVAGQKIYNNIAIELIKGTTYAVLVYDTTNPDTFNSLQSWYEGIKEENSGKDIRGLLIGNKADWQSRVTTEDGHAFAQEIGFDFVELSAMRFDDVEAPFIEIARQFYQSYEDRISQLK